MIINLTEDVKDLYTKNHKTLMKEKKTEINENILCVHELEGKFVKMSLLPM